MVGESTTVGETLRRWALKTPDAIALSYGARQTTYAELDRRANQVADRLRAAGIDHGSRIAILAKNNDRFLEILFGAARLGAVLVPVNFRLAGPEVLFVVDDAGAEIFFVDPGHADLVRRISDSFATVRQIVALEEADGDWPGFEAWRDAGRPDDPAATVVPGDVAVQMYTSGTTGHPKGVETTHHNIHVLQRSGTASSRPWQPGEVSLVAMPLYHIGGTGFALMGFFQGARNIILPDVVPAEILRLIENERVSRTFIVPAVIQFMLREPSCATTDLSSLKVVDYGASPIAQDVLRRALDVFKCDFNQMYGLTETTGAIVVLPPEDHDPEGGARMASCGRPWGDVELRVVGGDGRDVPTGEVGEVLCRTEQVMRAYWNRPEATADAIDDDGWFRTGDAGYLDSDGYLYIHDRIKDMIISGGENIYPAEVEGALSGHPAIADIAVIGVADPTWREVPMALAVLAPGAALDLADLQVYARERLAGYKVPKRLKIVDSLPRNPSGKILKRVLRAEHGDPAPTTA